MLLLTDFERPSRRAASRRLSAALLAAALLAGAAQAPSGAQAQTQPQPQAPQGQAPANQAPAGSTTKFGDWTQRCTPNPPPPASPPAAGQDTACFITQQLINQSNQQLVLKITVGFFEPGRQPGAVLAMPLGVPLADGVQIGVDGKGIVGVPFQFCRQDGCQAYLRMSDEVVKAFKAGNQGAVQLASGSNNPLTMPFSLSGFTAGYDSLK
ncbi:MAG: hypothetical protein Tsb0032_43880 [Kiloniellaceae bacterium]